MDCNICIEKYNNSSHLPVQCEFCEFICCRKCCETYILDNNDYASCMECKKQWDRKSLLCKFTRKFVEQDYKKHCENLLFNVEKVLLPATQPIIENMKKKEEMQKEMNEILKQIHKLRTIYYQYDSSIKNNTIDSKKIFIKKCPKESCRGFLSTQWKCGLCDYWTCPDCHELKGLDKNTDHTCKNENIETVKLLAKDSKSCPGCSIMIFKIEGCPQMFCTQCKTVFDWRTGRIDTGTVHNPHYFEWLRRNGKQQDRNPLDIQCGREIDHTFISQMQRIGIKRDVNIKYFENISRELIHIRFVELPRFISDRLTNNQDLRVQFLQGNLNENEFKHLLQKRTKKLEKDKEISNVLNTILTSSTEIIYRFFEELKNHFNPNTLNKFHNELLELIVYVNSCFEDISHVYKCKKYTFTTSMVLV